MRYLYDIGIWILIIMTFLFSRTMVVAESEESQPVIKAVSTIITINGKDYPISYVKVPLNKVRIKIGLAKGRVGQTESLKDIAKRYGAITAINGCFFDAYTSNIIKNPHHTIITEGKVVHKGNVGTVIGFTEDNQVFMERLTLKIEGGLDGSFKYPNNWYAYWINRFPESADTVTIFTSYWGKSTGLNDGIQIVVSNGRVVRIGHSSQNIPEDGYVIYFRGKEKKLAERFWVGRRCEYRIVREDGSKLGKWEKVKEAVGAGPRLLKDGNIVVDPISEGFSHPKILSMSGTRSMAGITKNGELILAVSSGTVREMAYVMKALGAYQAMNLDGGASSGLWVNDSYIITPGRDLSNALLILRR